MDEFLPPRFTEYGRIYTAVTGGVFLFTAGVIGYDTGLRWSTAEVPEETRWIGGPLWIQMAIGAAMLLYGVYAYRMLRSVRSNEHSDSH